jgi:hypothetical protein
VRLTRKSNIHSHGCDGRVSTQVIHSPEAASGRIVSGRQ